MNYEKRKEIVKQNRCCFKCLRFHLAKDCKVQIKCSWCGYNHDILMCQTLGTSNDNNNSTEI